MRATVEHANAYAIAADGARFATAERDGTVRIWSTKGRLIDRTRPHRSPIDTLAFSADGARLLAQATDGFAALLDVHLDRHTTADLATLAARAPWRLVEGELVPR